MNDPDRTLTPVPGDPKSTAEYHDPDAPPQQIGRYRVQKILGKGGFGLVYLAYDDQLKRAVAIKVAHARLIAEANDAEAYLTEARTVANLDHPNIVPVHDVGSTEQFPCYVVSKYIDGTDLFTRLKQSRLPLNEAVELVATVAEALHYAHKQEIVHRDIKPGNILLDKSGKPFVSDFGLALREQDVGHGPIYAGTPAYMSPEQARGEGHRVDGRSDIFSLGVVFYEMLTGKRPFRGESTAELLVQVTTFEPRPPRQLEDHIPKELERICLKALAKRASERYSTAKDMADDLRHWLGTVGEDRKPAEAKRVTAEPELAPATPGVGKDVFLSYATPDKEAVFRLCRLLEEKGISCWIAPRDVMPGVDYAVAIVRAIEGTGTTILFLSTHANASIHVTHEVERATSKRKRVIPICLEDVKPGPSLELHLATAHRLDAFRLSPEKVAAQLVIALRGENNTPSPAMRPPVSDQAIRIVPKGLRSFDAGDADFFLELLPGPRDRDGLPDSIRFWKTRIEQMDADNTFSVGLIYGPSGCGKSSLMKAGLLPRLAGNVIAVYVEATAEETEARLLNGLRKRCPALPANLGLKETLAALRRGQGIPVGKKVLIVLDQFEQWLHAKKDEENTELVQALRQCDGGRVQCIVMVRDDFWLAVSRFLRELEIRLLEGQNSALADLFDMDHARKVLAAFGRAFGKLPENPGENSSDQKEFLTQAVSGLAQEGKVVSVRLSLFAEMMKGKSWTPAALKEVGGTEGVGVTFLEETFSATTAPPEHRYHQKAARGVLKALLPESGTDIKGHMQSHAELLKASGYANRPKDFDDLLRILDSEIRLITPTDPEGKDGDSSSQVQDGAKYYQLTHDYLVPSLRDWLTRKQKETRRGRAELLLADRAAVWNARPENRQLPSLLQWLQIRWLTQKKNWTSPQRKMMRKATRYHVLRGVIVTVLLLAGSLIGSGVRSHVVEQENASHAAGLVKTLLNAKIGKVPEIIKEIDEYRTWADPLLREANEKTDLDAQKKLHVSLALLPVAPRQASYVYDRLLEADPSEVPVLRDALFPHKEELLDKLWAVAERPGQGKESQRLRAACALAKYDPESQRWAKVQDQVANDLVAVPVVFSSIWIELLRDVGGNLQAPLAVIFRDGKRRETERSLATDILADYAADQPQVLADLLMDADEKQFAVIYPKFKEQSERGLPVLSAEIDKKQLIVKDKIVFEKEGKIAEGDAKVKTQSGLLPAKPFEVRLQAGKQYRLTMDSQDLDSFLVLQDKTGKELAFDDNSGGGLNSMLVYTPSSDDTYTVFAAALQNQKETKNTGAFVLKIMATANPDENKEKLAKRQANAAVALLRMKQHERVWHLLKRSKEPDDPRVRSYLIHRFGPLGADAGAIVKRLDEESDITIQRALILSLGEFEEKSWSADDRNRVTKNLQEIYRTAGDPGLHAASEWLLRSWKQDDWLRKVSDDWAKNDEQREKRLEEIKQRVAKEKQKTPPQWYVNGQGQTMVVIPGPVEFVMGSPPTEADRRNDENPHKKRIGRAFAIASKSVTMEQYREFAKGYDVGEAKYHRMADLPVVGTSWYQAAAYCNWLSEKEGIDEKEWCYEIKGKVTKLRENYLSLSGYRLPTEAEMEYVTRAGAVTSRYFGETEELLPKYAWYTKNSKEQTWPVGSLKPNDLGLFDVQGNAYTWCQESYKAYPTGKGEEAAEDKEDELVISPTQRRVLRGGSFVTLASLVRSASRSSDVPTLRLSLYGFRPARTLPLDGFTALPPTP